MRLFVQIQNIQKLSEHIGTSGALRFVFSYALLKSGVGKSQNLHTLPVGRYRISFENIHDFVGLFSEIFFKDTYYLKRTAEPIRIVDCGANIGISLLYFKMRAPNATVLCFEPNPGARSILLKNIEQNHWTDSVTIKPYALSSSKGTTEFYIKTGSRSGSDASMANVFETASKEASKITVETDTLSTHLTEPVDLLKVDIEGPELVVLEELESVGAFSNIRQIQLEYHYMKGHFTRPLSDVLTVLERNGFKTFVESIASPKDVVNKDTNHTYMVFAWKTT